MKYIRRLKENLILNFNDSLKFSIIFREFAIGAILVMVSAAAIHLFYNSMYNLISIFIGFSVSYFLFADTSLYLFRHIKKLSLIKFNLNIIKDLLIVLFFFIIAYKFIKINFVLTAAGFTITPVSAVIMLIFFYPSV
jgi:hypothetical protein